MMQHEYTVSQSASRRERENCEYLTAPRSVDAETVRDSNCFLRSQRCCRLPQQSVPVVDILLILLEATDTLLYKVKEALNFLLQVRKGFACQRLSKKRNCAILNSS